MVHPPWLSSHPIQMGAVYIFSFHPYTLGPERVPEAWVSCLLLPLVSLLTSHASIFHPENRDKLSLWSCDNCLKEYAASCSSGVFNWSWVLSAVWVALNEKPHFHLAALNLAGFSQIKFIQSNSWLSSPFPPLLKACSGLTPSSSAECWGLGLGYLDLLPSPCCRVTKPLPGHYFCARLSLCLLRFSLLGLVECRDLRACGFLKHLNRRNALISFIKWAASLKWWGREEFIGLRDSW